jgi:exosortase/archaeosortase family protein
VGAAAIASLNIVRVVTLWVIGRHWRAAFDTAHFTIWPFLIILFTAGAFLLWLRLVAKGRHAAPGPAA